MWGSVADDPVVRCEPYRSSGRAACVFIDTSWRNRCLSDLDGRPLERSGVKTGTSRFKPGAAYTAPYLRIMSHHPTLERGDPVATRIGPVVLHLDGVRLDRATA